MTEPDPALAALGLTAAQAVAYELLVDSPDATIAELLETWPRDEALAEVLDGLRAAGLVQASSDSPVRYAVVAPRMAFEARLADRWRQLGDLRERVDRLARDLRAQTQGAGVVEVVTGPAAVQERLRLALRSTRRELRCCLGPPPSPMPPLPPGATCRLVTSGAVSGVAPGVQVRELPAVPVTMYLVDDRLAVLPADPDDHGTVAALVVHPSELLHTLGLLFESLWERVAAAHPEPERLVGLLLAGLTDDAIGRALAVSPRTVQRRVAAMMAAAGARTRFQAGVQAALRRPSGSPLSAPRWAQPAAGQGFRATAA